MGSPDVLMAVGCGDAELVFSEGTMGLFPTLVRGELVYMLMVAFGFELGDCELYDAAAGMLPGCCWLEGTEEGFPPGADDVIVCGGRGEAELKSSGAEPSPPLTKFVMRSSGRSLFKSQRSLDTISVWGGGGGGGKVCVSRFVQMEDISF